MNSRYDYEGTRTLLQALYAGDATIQKTADVSNAATFDIDSAFFQSVRYPPSARLMTASNGEEEPEELLLKVYGVLCSYWLPPILNKPQVTSLSHLRNMRQQVKITGLNTPEFDAAWKSVTQALDLLKRHLHPETLQALEFMPYEGQSSIEAHARYFTDRGLVPYEKNIAFGKAVDPLNIMTDVQPPQFLHGTDNHVEYCKKVTREDGTNKYVAFDPSMFKPGDVVEVTFALEAERTVMAAREYSSKLSLKRRRLYLEEEVEEKDKKHHKTGEGRGGEPLHKVGVEGESLGEKTDTINETMNVDA